MKKIVICLALLLSAAGVSAQKAPKMRVEWGVLGGVNISNFTAKDISVEAKDKLGFQAGISMALNFGAVALEPQLIFVRNTVDMNIPGAAPFKLKANTLQVPLLFSIRLLKPVRINVGPVFNVLNDAKYDSDAGIIDFGRATPTVSYMVGIGVIIARHFLIDVRYNGQFTSVKNVYTERDYTVDMRTYSIGVSIGYIF